MIAWLLHLHGVWIGKARATASPETNPPVGTENMQIKRYLRAGRFSNFRDDLMAMVETDGRWLVKAANVMNAAEHWKLHFPGTWWLCPQRELDDIVRSRMLHPGTSGKGEAGNRSVALNQIRMQDRLIASTDRCLAYPASILCSGGPEGEKVAAEIFRFVEIDFDPVIYHDWVDPGRWHHG